MCEQNEAGLLSTVSPPLGAEWGLSKNLPPRPKIWGLTRNFKILFRVDLHPLQIVKML